MQWQACYWQADKIADNNARGGSWESSVVGNG
jgi:hypothetical protein